MIEKEDRFNLIPFLPVLIFSHETEVWKEEIATANACARFVNRVSERIHKYKLSFGDSDKILRMKSDVLCWPLGVCNAVGFLCISLMNLGRSHNLSVP